MYAKSTFFKVTPSFAWTASTSGQDPLGFLDCLMTMAMGLAHTTHTMKGLIGTWRDWGKRKQCANSSPRVIPFFFDLLLRFFFAFQNLILKKFARSAPKREAA
jgi:hypothetical protein